MRLWTTTLDSPFGTLFTDGDNTIYLSGSPDCVVTSSNLILDWKSCFSSKGTPISSYLSSEQIDVYSLFWQQVDKGAYIKLNDTEVKDIGVVSLDQEHKLKILNKYAAKARSLYDCLYPILV